MKTFYTYLHCKPDGEPFYVGKGTGISNKARRCFELRKDRNNHYLNVVKKYGSENILIYVFPSDNESQAFADEIHQIAQLRSEGYRLTNLTNGGDGKSGYVVTDETKKRLSDKMKLNYLKMPESQKKIISERISIMNRGRIFSKETREKLSKAQLGKVMSDEFRKKISEINKGNKNCLGIKHTEQAKQRMSESAKKRWSTRIIKHGTLWRYNQGCRCDCCKSNRSLYMKNYKLK